MNRALIKCRVTVKTTDREFAYEGLFATVYDAINDGQDRAAELPCVVRVKVLP